MSPVLEVYMLSQTWMASLELGLEAGCPVTCALHGVSKRNYCKNWARDSGYIYTEQIF